MLAIPDIGIEVILLIVAGIVAGISRVVDWAQKIRRRSIEEQKQRADPGGFAAVESEAKARPRPGARVETKGTTQGLADIVDGFLSSTPFPTARPELAPARPQPPPRPRTEPSRLLLGGKPDPAAALPPARVPAPAVRSVKVEAQIGAYAIKKRTAARRGRLPADLKQAIIAREVLGPPRAAIYLRSVPRR